MTCNVNHSICMTCYDAIFLTDSFYSLLCLTFIDTIMTFSIFSLGSPIQLFFVFFLRVMKIMFNNSERINLISSELFQL